MPFRTPFTALFVLLAASLLLASLLPAQKKSELGQDVTDRFEAPEGHRVVVWADSPQIFNPTAMDVDARGRLWVTEAVNYRRFNPGRNPGRDATGGDRVVILEDTDGDGVCDKSKTFVQDPELVSPLGILVLEDRVLVSCSPAVYAYFDDDGDDVADRREVFLTGFGGYDHDHGLHSLVGGPDGKLYFNAGNAGPHVVTDKSGWTLRSGSIYRGGSAKSPPNNPGLISDDGKVWTGGLVMRVNLDGTGLCVLAHNFRNPYEVAIDSFGNLWQSDNDDDGNQGCRTTWVMETGNYGYFSTDGSRSWNADRRPGQDTQTAHWHQDDPGVMPAGCINGAGGPTGVCVYEGGTLPSSYLGAVLNCDAGRNIVYAHHPKADGAGYALEKGTLLRAKLDQGNDRSTRWFRPSDVTVGIDGTVFVADWYDPGVGGHAAGDRESAGRIFRIVPERAPKNVTVNLTTTAGQLAALNSPAGSIRFRAARALAKNGGEDVAKLLRGKSVVRDSRDPSTTPFNAQVEAARAVWLLDAETTRRRAGITQRSKETEVSDDALSPSDRVALGMLLNAGSVPAKDLLRLAGHKDPAVRRLIATHARHLSNVPLELLITLAKHHAPSDRFLLEAIGALCASREEDVFHAVAAQDPSFANPLTWSPRLCDLAWRLHPASLVPALQARAMGISLSALERRRATDALAFITTRGAADAMVTLAMAGPDDVRALAAFWVRSRDGNDWAGFGLGSRVAEISSDGATEVWTSGNLERGSKECDVDVSGAEMIWLVATTGADGNNSFDWADWIHPRLVSDSAELRLTDIPLAKATVGWGSLGVNRNSGGKPLSIDGKTYENGFGAHAASELIWKVPSGSWTRFRATVGVDDGGSRQGGDPDVEFKVLVRRKVDRAWVMQAVATVLNDDAKAFERTDALKALGKDSSGALHILELAARGTLPASLKDAASEALRNNDDLSIRALATARFPRVAKGGIPLPPLDQLAAMTGDPVRGREVFHSTAASCSRCHAMGSRGGDIGPDLTMIRAKYGRAPLLDAILNPSAGIAFGYDTWLVGTKDDELYSGFILADGERLVIKDISGERHAIPKDQVDFRRKESSSPMPDNVAMGLDAQQLADLASYLLDDPDRPLKKGETVDLLAEGISQWTAYLPGGDPKKVWSFAEGVLTCEGNPAGYVRTNAFYTNFILEVEWRFDEGRVGNSGVLMRVHGEDRVWPKSVEAQLQHRNAGDIWNIGQFPMRTDPSRTSGEHTRKKFESNEVPVGEWNRYRIVMDRGKLQLFVNGDLQNEADDVEERPGSIALQSEGARIHFRNVHLTPLLR